MCQGESISFKKLTVIMFIFCINSINRKNLFDTYETFLVLKRQVTVSFVLKYSRSKFLIFFFIIIGTSLHMFCVHLGLVMTCRLLCAGGMGISVSELTA